MVKQSIYISNSHPHTKPDLVMLRVLKSMGHFIIPNQRAQLSQDQTQDIYSKRNRQGILWTIWKDNLENMVIVGKDAKQAAFAHPCFRQAGRQAVRLSFFHLLDRRERFFASVRLRLFNDNYVIGSVHLQRVLKNTKNV